MICLYGVKAYSAIMFRTQGNNPNARLIYHKEQNV